MDGNSYKQTSVLMTFGDHFDGPENFACDYWRPLWTDPQISLLLLVPNLDGPEILLVTMSRLMTNLLVTIATY